jgi:hypothetical protein
MTEVSADNPPRQKQKHPRAPVKLRARLSSIDPEREPVDGGSYYRVCDDTCVNLSESGAQITGGDPMAVGRRVLIELELPDSDPFEASARVTWSEVLVIDPELPLESGTGVEFTRMSAANRRILETYMKGQLRRVRSRRSRQTNRPTVART